VKSILLLVWLGAPLALHSATPFGVTAWTVDDGLPQNIVRGLHQTPDGYLWIATLDGLARFDGVRFTVFDRNTTPEIKSGRFAALYGSPTGDLWLSTDGSGLTRYHKGRFITYTQRDCLPVDAVRCVTGDGAGNVWALAADAILKWNETTGRFTDVTPPDRRLRYDWALWEGGGFWGADRNGVHLFCCGPVPRLSSAAGDDARKHLGRRARPEWRGLRGDDPRTPSQVHSRTRVVAR
jgi:ligand-binding sensor domain-containing protein